MVVLWKKQFVYWNSPQKFQNIIHFLVSVKIYLIKFFYIICMCTVKFWFTLMDSTVVKCIHLFCFQQCIWQWWNFIMYFSLGQIPVSTWEFLTQMRGRCGREIIRKILMNFTLLCFFLLSSFYCCTYHFLIFFLFSIFSLLATLVKNIKIPLYHNLKSS